MWVPERPPYRSLPESCQFPERETLRRSPISATRRSEEKLTVDELCVELLISRSTFYDWRQKGRAPRCVKLPNGSLRVRRSDLENWLTDCEAAA
ncbi:helix-turn-helix transcriptional regulator [Streptomyces sp. NRRL F-6491]|uniref:helix-turn-helix transcriptional regulator n=1 Tax=Streptomyces sp. NRRL F-6491 TaxID=1519495 RepID=UPI003B63AA44